MSDPNLAAIVDRFLDQNERAGAVRDFPAHGLALLRFVRDRVHPGDVFGDRVAFVPGIAEAACDAPADGDDQGDDVTVDGFQVEQGQSLSAILADIGEELSQGDKAAFVVNGETLAVIIEALSIVPRCRRSLTEKVGEVLPVLQALFAEVFADRPAG